MRQYQVPVYKRAAEFLVEKDLRRVVDLGCGDGTKLAFYIKPSCSDIVGLDIDVNRLRMCELRLPKSLFIQTDLEGEVPVPMQLRQTDLLICADVLEHLQHPQDVLSKIPPNIWCVFSTPDVDTLNEKVYPNPTHKQAWTKIEFENMLIENGFSVAESKYYQEIVPYKGVIVICRKEV